MSSLPQPMPPRIWPADFATRGTEVYAILDGARDPRIHQLVASSELTWRCLYAGALPAEVLEVAPYLAHVRPNSTLTRALLSTGWGCAWGIWAMSAAPFDELRRHLRRFLRVRDESGRRLLFRYYDPVVLAAFLPTCTTRELGELFGPIDVFIVEAGTGTETIEYRFDGSALRERRYAGASPC
ncbi:MAG: DUF4123 domain-containing protein [Myxococcales bacterium]|nr:DUF4123 domain-containing protein [Myxococcales bacterium]